MRCECNESRFGERSSIIVRYYQHNILVKWDLLTNKFSYIFTIIRYESFTKVSFECSSTHACETTTIVDTRCSVLAVKSATCKYVQTE